MSGTAFRKHQPSAPPARAPGAVAQRLKTFEALRPGPSGGRQAASAGDPLVQATSDVFQVRDTGRGVMVRPNGTYNFVRVAGETRARAETLVSTKAGHAAIAGGRPVLYAGTARFDNGALEWWSNYSGTYQPMAAFKGQAGLPVDRFQPWQKLQMGGVGMQRGTFLDRREPSAPSRPAPDASEAPTAAAPAPTAAPSSPAPATPSSPVSGERKAVPVRSTVAAGRSCPTPAPGPRAAPAAGSPAATPVAAPAPKPLAGGAVAPVPAAAGPAPAPAQPKRVRAGLPPPPVRWSAAARGGR